MLNNFNRRTKGILLGFGMILLGIATSIYGYFDDIWSHDLYRLLLAERYAWLHVVLWTLGGSGVMLWYMLKGAANDEP